jgi:glycosyltransferase involved in cell wall biosynthesis
VRAAHGQWIALLDDDDEWLPNKLFEQMKVARASSEPWPIICTRVIARSPTREFTWPRRLPEPGEPLGEYLFARRGLFQGEGLVQSSMILTPRALMELVPFDERLTGHQDWDWALRAAALPGAALRFVPEPLVVWYIEEDRSSLSRSEAWEESIVWIESVKAYVTPRAYAAFIAVVVGPRAAQAGALAAAPRLFRQLVGGGHARAIDLLIFAGVWLVPRRLRRWLRGLIAWKPAR